MNSTIEVVLFVSLFAAAVVWLGLVLWVFHRLRNRHLATFEAIGSPSLIWNNSMRTNWLFFKFLFGPTWQQLDDRRLAVVLHVMRVYIVMYLVAFAAMFVMDFT